MRLSEDLGGLESRYDAIVVGSGYGGGVAASRLARMGLKVAVLERGREHPVGTFPDNVHSAEREFQTTAGALQTGARTGLFDLRLGRDIHVLVGCGLGGGSLINANVSLAPDPRVWEDPAWPAELTDNDLEEGFARARRMLRPKPFPETRSLLKLDRLGESAKALGIDPIRPPINVVMEAGPNAANVVQPACTLCGDCCSGCNVGAKTTVAMCYLPDAVNHGARIFCEVTVSYVRREAGGWRVFLAPTRTGPQGFATELRSIEARIVVLAAGSLGSTEILLRSREQGLVLSDRLGQRFTGNGDVLAFAYNNDRPVNGIGAGHPIRSGVTPPGPCIAGSIDLRASGTLEEGMIIEEGVLPSGLAPLLPPLFAAAGALTGHDTDKGIADAIRESERRALSWALGAYYGAMHATQTFLVMAHDDAGGVLSLSEGRLRLEWPGVAEQPVYRRVEAALNTATAATGGTFVRNPLQSTKILDKTLVTVHPLGGCPMGRDAQYGVVDHACRVFDPASGPKAVHEGLYVCDGAVMARPLGVNPLLTISAIAERAMIQLSRGEGRALTDAPKVDAPLRRLDGEEGARRPVGVEFTERMAGFISDEGADYHAAAIAGRERGTAFSFLATIIIDDIDRFISDPEHTGRITGTAECAQLSPEPLDISAGVFKLMRRDEGAVETRRFDYLMTLTARDGRTCRFAGHKIVRSDESGADLWRDTTALFVELEQHSPPQGRAKGVLTIAPADFARQLTTLRGTGGASLQERFSAVARFGGVFAGALYDVYGGLLAPLRRFDPARVRKKRDLRAPTPEVHTVPTDDGKRLRLIRYKGGTKGPVLFSHGLGVSSLIFTIDTIDTSLLEFMVAQGYDCWLLDFRASIDLPYARERATADDAANRDYQPAINLVREKTGAPSVQVIAHCFGATTFVMSLLRGLQGVRAAVISQIATDVIVPAFPQRTLAMLRLPSLLDALGIDHVNARATTEQGFANRLVDGLIRIAVPFSRDERTRNATSNRITALYGQLYETAQLNHATFESGLAEMFGEANIAAFRHLALIARRRVIVDAHGRDVYLPHLDRMALPISIIHGAKNACFRPESTERTLARLIERNGARFYERHLIPGYGHIDCIFGKDAARDVFPLMLRHLEATASYGG